MVECFIAVSFHQHMQTAIGLDPRVRRVFDLFLWIDMFGICWLFLFGNDLSECRCAFMNCACPHHYGHRCVLKYTHGFFWLAIFYPFHWSFSGKKRTSIHYLPTFAGGDKGSFSSVTVVVVIVIVGHFLWSFLFIS